MVGWLVICSEQPLSPGLLYQVNEADGEWYRKDKGRPVLHDCFCWTRAA